MWIGLAKIVACFYLCSTLSHANDNKISEKYPKKYAPANSVIRNSYDNFNYRSRYSKFDKVMSRIDKMNTDDDPDDAKQTSYRLRHKGWGKFKFATTTTTTEMSLFETYGDLDEGDNEFENYDDSLEDVDDDFDYEDEDTSSTEDPFFDTVEDVQAEEPTERPAPAPFKPISTLTEYKWNHFGTRSRVEESRRQQLNLTPSKEQSVVQAVIDHYVRVSDQSRCQNPLPRVIPVQHEHPNPSKTYTPRCTILHRCADDSGCCKRDTKCHYKTRVLVQLYFYTKTLGSSQTKVEKLEFYNHTECECKQRSSYASSESTKDMQLQPQFKSADEFFLTTAAPQNVRRCTCPSSYVAVTLGNKCSCDCQKDNQDCVQLKKGKEHFSMINRICIQDGDCDMPLCEYGIYSIDVGKCPSKKEKLEEYRRMRPPNF